jgi:hypothetical protein
MIKMENAKSISAIPISWAKSTIYATLVFLVLLALLHFVTPGLDPKWRMISEYAIGDHGWLMVMAFILWAFGFISLFFAIRSQIRSWGGKIGLLALWISALGLVIGGIFVTDPVTASREELTTSGMLHNIGGTLGMAMPLAVILISWVLYKKADWEASRKSVLSSAVVALVGFLVSFLSLVIILSKSNGVFSPDAPVGVQMRLEVLGYCVWQIVIAKQAITLKTKQTRQV